MTKLADPAYGDFSVVDLLRPVGLRRRRAERRQQLVRQLLGPLGGIDFTAAVPAIESAACNDVLGSFVDASDLALSTAVGQTGLKTKQFYFTGHDQNTLSSFGGRGCVQR